MAEEAPKEATELFTRLLELVKKFGYLELENVKIEAKELELEV